MLRSILDLTGDDQGLSQAAARTGADLSAVPGDAGAVGARWRLRIGDRRALVPELRHADPPAPAYRGARPDQPPPCSRGRTPGNREPEPRRPRIAAEDRRGSRRRVPCFRLHGCRAGLDQAATRPAAQPLDGEPLRGDASVPREKLFLKQLNRTRLNRVLYNQPAPWRPDDFP